MFIAIGIIRVDQMVLMATSLVLTPGVLAGQDREDAKEIDGSVFGTPERRPASDHDEA